MAMPGALDQRDALLDRVRSLLGPISELRGESPSVADLGELDFAATWDLARRERFAKGLIEALEASIDADDPAPVEQLVHFISHADDPVRPQFKSSFLDELRDEVRAHIER